MKLRRSSGHRHLVVWLAVLGLLAAACSASTTVEQSTVAESADTEDTNESAASEPDTGGDTAADPTPEPADEPEPTPEPESQEDEPEPTPEPESQEDEGQDDAPTSSADDELSIGETRIVMLDPGVEPRTELRLTIAASCTEVMTMTTTQEISQTIDGQAVPGAGPIGNVMEMATSASPTGDNYEVRAEVISAVASPDTPLALAPTINAELSAIVGLTSYATLTDRAVQVPGTSRVEGTEALGPMASVVESLNQSQSPLPEEAVGVGARWETTSLLELEGLLITTTVTTELLSIDGTIIELRLVGSQLVDPDSRMRTQGLVGEVTQWDVTTTGTTLLDLATINPISSSLSTGGVQAFDFGADGELEQDIATDIITEAQPNDGCTGRTIRG